jgi:hypothetical protein
VVGNIAVAIAVGTEYDGRNTLVQVRKCITAIVRVELGVTVRIDESGRNPQAACIDGVHGPYAGGLCIADEDNIAVPDAIICNNRF